MILTNFRSKRIKSNLQKKLCYMEDDLHLILGIEYYLDWI